MVATALAIPVEVAVAVAGTTGRSGNTGINRNTIDVYSGSNIAIAAPLQYQQSPWDVSAIHTTSNCVMHHVPACHV